LAIWPLKNSPLKPLTLLLFIFVLMNSCQHQTKQKPNIDFCANTHRNDTLSLTQQLTDIDSLMCQKTGVYVLDDGAGALVTRAWFCEYAERTIDIQYFIFSTDNVGLIGCDYLVRAADRGVKIRIIVDDIMVNADPEDILIMDSHPNISIKIYNTGINLGKSIWGKAKKLATDFRSANQRMHNKTFIVDGRIAVTGGRNLADEYYDYDHEYNFRDRDVLLWGKATAQMDTSFNQFWDSPLSMPITQLLEKEADNANDPHRFDKLHQYACDPENFWPQIRTRIDHFQTTVQRIKNSGELVWVDSVAFVSDMPGKNDGSQGLGGGGVCTNALISLVKNAKRSIDIQSPYLITTDLGQKLFREAVNRGVKVRILTNSLASTDNVDAFSSYQKDRQTLLSTGIHIFEFKPDAAERYKIMTGEIQKKLNYAPIFGLHAKTMVVDGQITVIGTFNLDPRSANLNTECVAIVHSEKVAAQVTKAIEQDIKPENAWEITKDWNPDSQVGAMKRAKTWTRKVLPKDIL
jgi:putative cardiolipin synthase